MRRLHRVAHDEPHVVDPLDRERVVADVVVDGTDELIF
jgi:hypothetical protein